MEESIKFLPQEVLYEAYERRLQEEKEQKIAADRKQKADEEEA